MLPQNHWDPLSQCLLRPPSASLAHLLPPLPNLATRSPRAAGARVWDARDGERGGDDGGEEGGEEDGEGGGKGGEERRVWEGVSGPWLFEDMVKCILLCNCHRTGKRIWDWKLLIETGNIALKIMVVALDFMARALCELQLELQGRSMSVSAHDSHQSNLKSSAVQTVNILLLAHWQ
ncbi:hypothetical protein AKJ16_DCAP21715 [Drosera capensis]